MPVSIIDHVEAVLNWDIPRPPSPTHCTFGCLSWPAGSRLHTGLFGYPPSRKPISPLDRKKWVFGGRGGWPANVRVAPAPGIPFPKTKKIVVTARGAFAIFRPVDLAHMGVANQNRRVVPSERRLQRPAEK